MGVKASTEDAQILVEIAASMKVVVEEQKAKHARVSARIMSSDLIDGKDSMPLKEFIPNELKTFERLEAITTKFEVAMKKAYSEIWANKISTKAAGNKAKDAAAKAKNKTKSTFA